MWNQRKPVPCPKRASWSTAAARLSAFGIGLCALACSHALRRDAAGQPAEPLNAALRAPWTELSTAIGCAVAGGEVPGAVCVVGRGSAQPFSLVSDPNPLLLTSTAKGKKAHKRGSDSAPAGAQAGPPDPTPSKSAAVTGPKSVQAPAEFYPLKLDSRFDLASLTKPVATATAVALLVDRGQLDLDRPLALDWPAFGAAGKQGITARQLLLHRAGLCADNPLEDWQQGPGELWRRIEALEPESEPGRVFRYSDVGYAILARLVERISGEPFDVFCAREIFAPLSMNATGFRPSPEQRASCVPTEPAPETDSARNSAQGALALQGVVHDPRARAIGGVAGHAGLFSTAEDLACWCRFWLGLGPLRLKPETRRLFLRATWLADGSGGRCLLGDVDTGYSSPRGGVALQPAGWEPAQAPSAWPASAWSDSPLGFWRGSSLGHTGFTGTSFWLDPESEAFVILLTSHLQGPPGTSVTSLRRRVGTLVGAWAHELERQDAAAPPPVARGDAEALRPAARVWSGAERLVRLEPERWRGQRVALVTHAAARLSDGRRTLDALRESAGVLVQSVWTPEHGLSAAGEGPQPDGRDPSTGLPLYSLYGDTKRPPLDWFRGLDAVFFDCQDVGVRFYTYATTLAYVLEAAGVAGVPVVLLDRPNPLGLTHCAGPVLAFEQKSFIGYAPVPLMHGLTLGELARFYVERLGVCAELHVVPCVGLRREQRWADFDLPFFAPSPNLRSPEAVALYPLLGCFEACDLSVGRGTPQPFGVLGAPWLDHLALAADLLRRPIPGLAVTPLEFQPEANTHAGRLCRGLRFSISGPQFEPASASLELGERLLALEPTEFDPRGLGERWGDPGLVALLGPDQRAEQRLLSAAEAFRRSTLELRLYPEGDREGP
jgi:uncharacterized protein YbbC (DUF1343 family)